MTESNKENPPAPPVVAAQPPASAPAAAAPAPATAAAAKAAAPEPKLEITGVRGGPLGIYGENLGAKGQLIINSREIQTSAWYTDEKSHITTIKAQLPNDVGDGPVRVVAADGRVFEGHLGAK